MMSMDRISKEIWHCLLIMDFSRACVDLQLAMKLILFYLGVVSNSLLPGIYRVLGRPVY